MPPTIFVKPQSDERFFVKTDGTTAGVNGKGILLKSSSAEIGDSCQILCMFTGSGVGTEAWIISSLNGTWTDES